MADRKDDEVTLKEAARLAGLTPPDVDPETPESERPANRPGAEATAALDAMLSASRAGKIVR
jgi:hypothetical protein